MLNLLKTLMGLLKTEVLEGDVVKAAVKGLKLGLKTAEKDTGKEDFIPDDTAIARIGLRAHALSEKTMAKARGSLAYNGEKLYQEMDAALEGGMSEGEALGQIADRVRNLFTDALQPWELERLIRDQFLVATKEGRRDGWKQGGVKWRQWQMHSDSKTGSDSKRMNGQITGIDEPYTDPLTKDKYMIEHIRPNDRCYGVPLFELPEIVKKDGLMYAKE